MNTFERFLARDFERKRRFSFRACYMLRKQLPRAVPLMFFIRKPQTVSCFFFFLMNPPPTEFSPLPLHAPLPIWNHLLDAQDPAQLLAAALATRVAVLWIGAAGSLPRLHPPRRIAHHRRRLWQPVDVHS